MPLFNTLSSNLQQLTYLLGAAAASQSRNDEGLIPNIYLIFIKAFSLTEPTFLVVPRHSFLIDETQMTCVLERDIRCQVCFTSVLENVQTRPSSNKMHFCLGYNILTKNCF